MSEGSSSTQVELRLDWGAWPGATTSTFGTSSRLHDAGAHHHPCSVVVADICASLAAHYAVQYMYSGLTLATERYLLQSYIGLQWAELRDALDMRFADFQDGRKPDFDSSQHSDKQVLVQRSHVTGLQYIHWV